MILRNWHLLLLLISSISIISALVAEYVFNLQPCELCLKQRHPYYFLILICLLLSIQIATIYGLFYAIWHVGVENNLLKGPAGCSSGLELSKDTGDLKAQILSQQVISCNDVVWSLFGLSAASINTMVMLFIFFINAIYIFKYYGFKKEKKII